MITKVEGTVDVQFPLFKYGHVRLYSAGRCKAMRKWGKGPLTNLHYALPFPLLCKYCVTISVDGTQVKNDFKVFHIILKQEIGYFLCSHAHIFKHIKIYFQGLELSILIKSFDWQSIFLLYARYSFLSLWHIL